MKFLISACIIQTRWPCHLLYNNFNSGPNEWEVNIYVSKTDSKTDLCKWSYVRKWPLYVNTQSQSCKAILVKFSIGFSKYDVTNSWWKNSRLRCFS